MPMDTSSQIEMSWSEGLSNIQSLQVTHLILQSVTIWARLRF